MQKGALYVGDYDFGLTNDASFFQNNLVTLVEQHFLGAHAANDPEFLAAFPVVQGVAAHPAFRHIPFMFCRSIGFFGTARLQVREHCIVETHADNKPNDMRMAGCLRYCATISTLDEDRAGPPDPTADNRMFPGRCA